MTSAVGKRRAPRPRRRNAQGVVAVEFALVVPILVMLLLGIVTLGLAYSHQLALTNAVREGARLGAAVDYNAAGPGTWADSVQQRVRDTYFDTDGVTSAQVCVRLVDSTGTPIPGAATASVAGGGCGTPPGPADMPATPAGTCVVQVWAHKAEKVTLGVFPGIQIGIGSRAASLYGRAVGSCSTP